MNNPKVYAVSTAHLDTVWRWNLAKTIEQFIPDTIAKNFQFIEKYENYKFNFEGAFRYELIEEYYPDAFEKIKEYVKAGKWCVAGSSYENGDVNIPSPEAIFRNILLGNNYFKEKFGVVSKDIFLPDCFGFGYALPSIIKHSNLKGFITQKLSWGSANGIPFDIGRWQGVDGSTVFASTDARSYRYKFSDVRNDKSVNEKILSNSFKYNIPMTLQLYGTGDWGGAPTEESVNAVNEAVKDNSENNFKVISASADEMFKNLEKMPKEETDKLPLWNGELLMTNHGAGGYTSRAMSKRLNRKCEDIANATERTLVCADLLTSYKYPQEIVNSAWKKVIRHQFHDDIPGTSIMEVYNESWNDYFIAQNQFRTEYQGAVGAIANELDTSFVEEKAIVVNNPVAKSRKEAVSAHIKVNHNAPYVRIFDANENEVPSQTLRKNGKNFEIVFLAEVEPLSYTVYSVKMSEKPCTIKTDLKVSEHSLENSKYRLLFNKNGDIGSIVDKTLNKEILDSPIKLALLKDVGALSYPSWETRKSDLDKEPYAFANTPSFEIVENSGARIAIKVTRTGGFSTFEQTVSLSSDSKTIRVHNEIDWQSRRTMLKAVFPFSCYNKTGVYDLGLGVIKRDNNTDSLYEVPAQKWADISNARGDFGVSIFSDSKYGWDKPASNTLRLTCIHTPTGAFIKDARQDLQDIGRNVFDFGIFSHEGNFENGTQIESEHFEFPLVAFETTAKRKGTLGTSYSLGNISNSNVLIRAIKKAENSNGIVVRVNEGIGKEQNNVEFSFGDGIVEAKEIFASEEEICDAKIKNGKLIFNIKPFEVKSFLIVPKVSTKKPASEKYKKLDLTYNTGATTDNTYRMKLILAGSGCSLPAEQFKDKLTVGGVTFKFADKNSEKNAIIARGETIRLPKGMTKLYIIAANVFEDKDEEFLIDKKSKVIRIHSMFDEIGKWDMKALNQKAKVKNDANVAIHFTHTHHPEDDKYNERATFFMYEIDIRNAIQITLPEDNRLVILAMSAVNKFANTYISTDIIDKTNDDFEYGEVAPIEKIIDKLDFATIRAGKIEDQTNGGKGKGFKRDNIVTNIIRSYTKSEW